MRTQNFRKNISYPLICTRTCTYQGIRNVSFSENFAYLLNEWSHIVWAFITKVGLLETLITRFESVEAIGWRRSLKFVLWRFSWNLQENTSYGVSKLLQQTPLQLLFCERSKNFWNICYEEHQWTTTPGVVRMLLWSENSESNWFRFWIMKWAIK